MSLRYGKGFVCLGQGDEVCTCNEIDFFLKEGRMKFKWDFVSICEAEGT